MATDGRAATLKWGVKQSFRGYVEASRGTIQAGGGAERTADGEFLFAAAPGPGLRRTASGELEGVARFAGDVRFEAHGGMLQVFLADPAVEAGAGAAVVTVADSPERDSRLVVATLDLAAATTGADGEMVIPTKLSRDGWRLLGDHYAPMTPLDPVRLRLG